MNKFRKVFSEEKSSFIGINQPNTPPHQTPAEWGSYENEYDSFMA